jgi:maltose alpha-D-glucosyltransferase / alpha-amylase
MRHSQESFMLVDDPFWYKDAIIYELHPRAFFDSDGDGVGDFEGLAQKLDYLQDLGVTALWLLPFYPSPLKDDGYDIADYNDVHPSYGTLNDFREFLREAHARGLRVITELIVNHTSDQHPWFQRARRAKAGSRWRNFYVWSDTPEKYKDARIIFKDFEPSNWSWDPVAKGYYWHRFYAHQPDLNYDNPEVRRAILHVVDFWLNMGIDGLRLDAVPYLYEREGTNCENLTETHAFLKELRQHVDLKYKNRMLLAEANQWPEDAVAYLGEGDECHMAFHFPSMPRLFMAIRMESRFPIIDILTQTPAIPDNCQWALFLRNHDELTLEMVTDEERDYMYRVYAYDPHARINLGIRRRLAPLLGNDRRRIELMNALLFALPGTPVIYYGDELRMGDNFYLGDRNGVRTPMQWSADRNAGFSRANPQRLYLPIIVDPEYHYEAVNVEAQQNNPHSLLWWMKRLIALRKRFKAFGRGTLEFLHPDNHKVLAFIRRYQDECVLVLANLSRFVQGVELDLSPFKSLVPVEAFGHTEFPVISEAPYFMTLGPHAFYWFALEPQRVQELSLPSQEVRLPILQVTGELENLFMGDAKVALEAILPSYLKARRWFGGKAKKLKSVQLLEAIPVLVDSAEAFVTLLRVDYVEGDPDIYVLPLTAAFGEIAAHMREGFPHPLLANLQVAVKGKRQGEAGVLYDALYEKSFSTHLLDLIARHRRLRGINGDLLASSTQALRHVHNDPTVPLDPAVIKAEQSNTSVVYGGRYILKLFRRSDEGINPDLEIGRFLTETAEFANVPPVVGALEYRRKSGGSMTLGILQEFVPNVGDAWTYTLDSLSHYFERALAHPEAQPPDLPQISLLDIQNDDFPVLARELIGSYLESARLLGQRTAELHKALAISADQPDFAPEPFSTLYQRSVYQSMQSQIVQVFQLLRPRLKQLPENTREDAQKVLDMETEVRRRYRSLLQRRISAMRIRVHGDYHLGQVLYTGRDFVIIDFEGEPARPLSERRIKRSPLRDVAGMLRSFHYVSYAALFGQIPSIRPADFPALEPWAKFWYTWVSVAFLKAYLAAAKEDPILPKDPTELQVLLEVYLLEKAVYELGYELNNRPEWVKVPLQGLLQLLTTSRPG